ncbi:MAG: SGNH/GDSL hydrolase family protein [Planctomycetota bacterium]
MFALLIVAGGLLVIEGAERFRQWSQYGRVGSFYAFRTDPVSGLLLPAPGVTEGRGRRIEVDSRGFRSPELELPKPAGRLRLAFLGGSTVFCAEASSNEATWPARVAAGLRQHLPQLGPSELHLPELGQPSVDLDFLNAGSAGFTTTESLTDWRQRVAATDPDVVVIYHSTNDLSRDSRQLAAAQGLASAAPPAERESWLARHSQAWKTISKNLFAGRPAADAGAETLQYDAAALAEVFRTNLRALVAACQQGPRPPLVVLVTFAHQQRREQPPEVQRRAAQTSLMWMPYMSLAGVLDGFDAHNRVIREVAAEMGALLVEGETAVPGDEEHFADSVHLTDAGCALLAERVLATLLAAPEFVSLAARAGNVAPAGGAEASAAR